MEENIIITELRKVRDRVAQAPQTEGSLVRCLHIESAFVQMLSILKVGVKDEEIKNMLKEIQDAYYHR